LAENTVVVSVVGSIQRRIERDSDLTPIGNVACAESGAMKSTHVGAGHGRWIQGALDDLKRGLLNWRLCHLIGLGDIRRRYARSRIGQFWLTISTGLTISTLGLVWSGLWNIDVGDFLPHITVSLIIWTAISGVISDATTVFASLGGLYVNQGMSFSTAIYSLIYRHFLIFLHNLPLILAVNLLFSVPFGFATIAVFAGFALLTVALTWMSYLVAIACVRFRDLTQVVNSLLLLAFFVSPILWKPDQIPATKHALLLANPLTSLLAIVREPLLGRCAGGLEWLLALAFSTGGFLLALPMFGYSQRRIIYWI